MLHTFIKWLVIAKYLFTFENKTKSWLETLIIWRGLVWLLWNRSSSFIKLSHLSIYMSCFSKEESSTTLHGVGCWLSVCWEHVQHTPASSFYTWCSCCLEGASRFRVWPARTLPLYLNLTSSERPSSATQSKIEPQILTHTLSPFPAQCFFLALSSIVYVLLII
jgi:hypothetical protein